MVKRIKKQMLEVSYKDALGREYRYGEFFPPDFFPWAYNESTAYEWFPLEKEEAIRRGFTWRDADLKEYQQATTTVPDHMKDVQDEVVSEVLKCEACGRNYRLIQKELEFYRRFQIPIPRECPLCRDHRRIDRLNRMKLYDRTCVKCRKNIQTTYSPDQPEIVYCESCYNAEVV